MLDDVSSWVTVPPQCWLGLCPRPSSHPPSSTPNVLSIVGREVPKENPCLHQKELGVGAGQRALGQAPNG